MKRLPIWLILGLIFVLAACSGGDEGPSAEPTEPSTAQTAVPALPTVPPDQDSIPTPEPPDEYPPPGADEGNPGPAFLEGYPALPEPEPTRDPYPGGLAVIQHPAGLQCEEPLYPDLESATAALEGAGIAVQESEEIDLIVCEACGCPTSLHYRVLIDPADLDTALSLKWQRGN